MIQFVFAAMSIALAFPPASEEAPECRTSLEDQQTFSDAKFREMASEAAAGFYDKNDAFKDGLRPRVLGYRVDKVFRRGPTSATVTMTLIVDQGARPDPVSIYVVIDNERVKLTGTTPIMPFPETESVFAKPTFDVNDPRVQGIFKRAARKFIEESSEWGILKPHSRVISVEEEGGTVTARVRVMFATKKTPNFWDTRNVEVQYNTGTGFKAAYID